MLVQPRVAPFKMFFIAVSPPDTLIHLFAYVFTFCFPMLAYKLYEGRGFVLFVHALPQGLAHYTQYILKGIKVIAER